LLFHVLSEFIFLFYFFSREIYLHFVFRYVILWTVIGGYPYCAYSPKNIKFETWYNLAIYFFRCSQYRVICYRSWLLCSITSCNCQLWLVVWSMNPGPKYLPMQYTGNLILYAVKSVKKLVHCCAYVLHILHGALASTQVWKTSLNLYILSHTSWSSNIIDLIYCCCLDNRPYLLFFFWKSFVWIMKLSYHDWLNCNSLVLL